MEKQLCRCFPQLNKYTIIGIIDMKTTEFINKKPKIVAETAPIKAVIEQQELAMPEFTVESAEAQYSKLLGEDATGGASSSASVATVVGGLGNDTQTIIKRQQGYTNQRTKGSTVKVKK